MMDFCGWNWSRERQYRVLWGQMYTFVYFMLVCLCALYVWACLCGEYMCRCECACVWGSQKTIACMFLTNIVLLRQVSSLAYSWAIRTDCQTDLVFSRQSSCHRILRAALASGFHWAKHFHISSGDQTQVMVPSRLAHNCWHHLHIHRLTVK